MQSINAESLPVDISIYKDEDQLKELERKRRLEERRSKKASATKAPAKRNPPAQAKRGPAKRAATAPATKKRGRTTAGTKAAPTKAKKATVKSQPATAPVRSGTKTASRRSRDQSLKFHGMSMRTLTPSEKLAKKKSEDHTEAPKATKTAVAEKAAVVASKKAAAAAVEKANEAAVAKAEKAVALARMTPKKRRIEEVAADIMDHESKKAKLAEGSQTKESVKSAAVEDKKSAEPAAEKPAADATAATSSDAGSNNVLPIKRRGRPPKK